ncbi:class I adenylate cyclase [Succinimonas sp.]|uniref:class I adenylate cyclase n=1 Tax=Succinimonas sp. TaxID=1936151 RepID=UPI00386F9394
MDFDYSRTKIYEQRYLENNRARIARALSMMNPEAQEIFNLVPVFLHYNHLAVPSYVEDSPDGAEVPHGIRNFELTPEQQAYISSLSGSAGYYSIISRDESILALYCMGSTSSIGQGPKSDIDYWVCVSRHMSAEKIALLEKKCEVIRQKAEDRGVEINLFIVKEDQFTNPQNDQRTDEESCGSAQKLFLLDEFYRSSIYLGGQKLVWMLVPREYEKNYSQYVEGLFRKKIIKREEWLDLGSVGKIPVDEYYGSALWLLYKGIDYPFKAALKIMLMEVYSAEYPDTELLSILIRDTIQKNDRYVPEMDSYYCCYLKIAKYLEQQQDPQREYLLKLCFYFKISAGMKAMADSDIRAERKKLFYRLLKDWNWSDRELSFIDERFRWHINEVRRVYGILFDSMMQSYKALLNFGIRNNIKDSIRFRDIRVLSRKLYTAFDTSPGKIKIYNLNIGQIAAESSITFVEAGASGVCRNGWYVYAQSRMDRVMISQKKPLAFFPDLGSAIVECWVNGMISEKTSISVHTRNPILTGPRIREFTNDLSRSFPEISGKITNEDLLNPEMVRDVAVFVNLERDPAGELLKNGDENINATNIFSVGSKRISLIGSVIMVLRTSWNQFFVNSYSETDTNHCITDFVKDVGRFFHRKEHSLRSLVFFQYGKALEVYIRAGMLDVLEKIRSCINNPQKGFFKINISGNDYVISCNYQGLSVTLGDNEIPQDPQDVPEAVLNSATTGLHQFFFQEVAPGVWDIFNSDTERRIKVYRRFTGNIRELVLDINRHYAKLLDNESNRYVRCRQYFNLPQYYRVSGDGLSIVPLAVP